METIVKTKQWGHSVGVILPANVVKRENIKPGEEIVISVSKRYNALQELRGALKFEEPTEKMLKEFRRNMDSKWLK